MLATGRRHMLKRFMMTAAALAVAGSAAANAAEFNDAQKAEIEKIASEYIAAHPEIIMQAMQKLQEDQARELSENVKKVGELYRTDASAPMVGDASAKHYVVDFFDYNCGYCKVMEPVVEKMLKDDKNSLQVIYVNLPVITKTSAMSATVAQAVFNLDREKFFELHRALMHDEVDANSLEALQKKVEDLGMDWDKVMAEMKSRRPQDKLAGDLERSKTLRITGTPYLIVDGREYRGAIRSEAELRALFRDEK